MSSTLLVVALLLIASLGIGCTSGPRPAEFNSPDEAANTFVTALRNRDRPELNRILGAEAVEALDSGDTVADQAAREKFLAAYDQKNELIRSSDDKIVVLNVGEQNWPLPIPITNDNKTGKWFYDPRAGVEEMVNRRIGQNELDVIEVCRAIVDAQREYATMDPNGDGVPEYARKIISDPGQRNGLYWETKEGEAPSPLGPLVADAVEQGYGKNRTADSAPRPYHGYYYRLLTSQGPNAQGGAMDYEIQGRMIGGFGVVAYPADYGDSGIMTFIVNHDGVVYQKDLGDDTEKLAKAMTTFDPGPGWTIATPVEETLTPAK
jgi:hypothetical protein